MVVIYYQLFIVLTLLIARVLLPKRFLICAVIWTALTLVNLFYPPLIAIQLLVVWGTFALLRPRGGSGGSVPQPVRAPNPSPRDASPVPAPTSSLARSETEPSQLFSTQPSWANPEKISQFKAAVMLVAMDRYSLPIAYLVQFVSNAESFSRLLAIAALAERSGLTFDEQAAHVARRVKWKWEELSSEEQEAFQADDSRLESLKF